MTPRHEVQRQLTQQWLNKADEDLSVAELLLRQESPFLSPACFHLQQAVEKYFKAILVRHQVEFPKTHNLGKLLNLVAGVEASLAADLDGVTMLDPFSVDGRYPGDLPEMTLAETEMACELVRRVRGAAHEILDSYLDSSGSSAP